MENDKKLKDEQLNDVSAGAVQTYEYETDDGIKVTIKTLDGGVDEYVIPLSH